MKTKGRRRSTGIPRVIAIDGPAAAGKSTVGREIGARLGYPFLDTGAIYRAMTWTALHRGVDLSDEDALSDLAASLSIDVGPPNLDSIEPSTIFVDEVDVTRFLRQPEVEAAVSLVSRVAGVRKALVRVQRELAGRNAVVMAGRDIGTVVLPKADLKVYLVASVEERARRRFAELSALGLDVTEEEVLHDLRRRDRIDSERSVSPLRPAEDAIVLDTDGLTLEEVVQRLAELVEGTT
ncbi:MAG: (d)CMP kinase [Chloroflexi bacterium]|nr:(d)CMP kinase [Chloroflexota bacterium]